MLAGRELKGRGSLRPLPPLAVVACGGRGRLWSTPRPPAVRPHVATLGPVDTRPCTRRGDPETRAGPLTTGRQAEGRRELPALTPAGKGGGGGGGAHVEVATSSPAAHPAGSTPGFLSWGRTDRHRQPLSPFDRNGPASRPGSGAARGPRRLAGSPTAGQAGHGQGRRRTPYTESATTSEARTATEAATPSGRYLKLRHPDRRRVVHPRHGPVCRGRFG